MLKLFVALSHSWLGQFMQNSHWGFAITEAVHLLALAALGGAVLMVDLRLLGFVLLSESARTVGRDLGRLLMGSLTVLIMTGIGLVSEEALKCYHSPAFRWKMALLAAAVAFYFTVHRSTLNGLQKNRATAWSRVVAVISLTLWLGVGVAGRAIGLL